jgi:membrane-associated phospholipid phosphatase
MHSGTVTLYVVVPKLKNMNKPIATIVLLCSFALDKPLQVIARTWSDSTLVHVFNRSFFEELSIGVSDIPIFIFLSWALFHIHKKRYQYLSFVLGSCLSIAASVHLLKGILGRRRPSSGEWLEFNFFQGWGIGSFPSGHTAMIASLLVFCFVYPKFARIGGLTVGLFIITMSMSRMAVGAHWFSDTMGSVLLSLWIIQIWKNRTSLA